MSKSVWLQHSTKVRIFLEICKFFASYFCGCLFDDEVSYVASVAIVIESAQLVEALRDAGN